MTGDGTHSVLLVDDDAMVRTWLRATLAGSEFRVAGEASTMVEALELLSRRRLDVALVDYRLPDGRGTTFVKQLREDGIGAPAVLMTANAEQGFNELAREAGAQGSILKTGRSDEIIAALKSVVAGKHAFDPRHPRRPDGYATLSPRQREMLRFVADGATNKEIASALDVGEETVKTTLSRAYARLGVGRRADAARIAGERGQL